MGSEGRGLADPHLTIEEVDERSVAYKFRSVPVDAPVGDVFGSCDGAGRRRLAEIGVAVAPGSDCDPPGLCSLSGDGGEEEPDGGLRTDDVNARVLARQGRPYLST